MTDKETTPVRKLVITFEETDEDMSVKFKVGEDEQRINTRDFFESSLGSIFMTIIAVFGLDQHDGGQLSYGDVETGERKIIEIEPSSALIDPTKE